MNTAKTIISISITLLIISIFLSCESNPNKNDLSGKGWPTSSILTKFGLGWESYETEEYTLLILSIYFKKITFQSFQEMLVFLSSKFGGY